MLQLPSCSLLEFSTSSKTKWQSSLTDKVSRAKKALQRLKDENALPMAFDTGLWNERKITCAKQAILPRTCNFFFISEMCWKPLVMCIYIFLSVIFSIWIYFKKCVLCIASVIETLPHSCIFLFIIDQSWYRQLHQTTTMKWFPFCGSVPHIKPKVCMVFEHYSLVKC